jgi:hypothetical protein
MAGNAVVGLLLAGWYKEKSLFMKITVSHIEKSIGLFFQDWGVRLKNDIKTDRILSLISASPFSLWSIITMVNSGVQVILIIFMTAIIVALFFGLFLVLFKIIGVVLISLGEVFTRQSQTARFSAKIIDQSQKTSLDKKFAVQISNKEWFADGENVSCNIGLVGHVADYDDLQILKAFDELPKNNFPPGSGGSGIWTDNDSEKIDIRHNSHKLLKFIKVDFSESKFYVSLTDYGKNNVIEIPCKPGKNLFLINLFGDIKDGKFYCNFEVEVIYKGKNDIGVKVKKENILVNVSQKKTEKLVSLWS